MAKTDQEPFLWLQTVVTCHSLPFFLAWKNKVMLNWTVVNALMVIWERACCRFLVNYVSLTGNPVTSSPH